jgi:hypothetical protein
MNTKNPGLQLLERRVGEHGLRGEVEDELTQISMLDAHPVLAEVMLILLRRTAENELNSHRPKQNLTSALTLVEQCHTKGL